MRRLSRIYNTPRWRATRARAIERDGGRCTVSRLLGGECSRRSLHVHHIVPLEDGGAAYELDNVGTSCASHHAMWEALRRQLVRNLVAEAEAIPRCPHRHATREARELCERRLARQAERRQPERRRELVA